MSEEEKKIRLVYSVVLPFILGSLSGAYGAFKIKKLREANK